jgi:hypothetical protein
MEAEEQVIGLAVVVAVIQVVVLVPAPLQPAEVAVDPISTRMGSLIILPQE